LPFGFKTLELCNFWQTYSLSLVKYPSNDSVSTFPWISVSEGQGFPSAKLKVSSNAPPDEAYYIVTVKGNKLYDNQTFIEPTFSFKIYIHPSPCLKSKLSWGVQKP
jgi:hypothetical protein